MKKMIPFLILASAVAHAEIPEVRARNVTCAEIQQTLASYSTITVVTKPFIFAQRLTVSVDIACADYQAKTQAYFNTADLNDCPVGFYCADRVVYTPAPNPGPYYPRPNPGPYYPNPNPGHYYPHPTPGPSHGGGGHYNPPHPGEHGGHYNPPSGGHGSGGGMGGSHGGHYNPPSGGGHSSGGGMGGSHGGGGGSSHGGGHHGGFVELE